MHARLHDHVGIDAGKHACTHAYNHTCLQAYMHTCIHAYIHACIHAYMHTYVCIYIYVYTYTTHVYMICIHSVYINTKTCMRVSNFLYREPNVSATVDIGQLIHVLEVLEEQQALRAAHMLRSMSIAAVPTPMLHFLYMMFPRVEWRTLFAPDILRSRDSHLLSRQCMEKQTLQKPAEAAGTRTQLGPGLPKLPKEPSVLVEVVRSQGLHAMRRALPSIPPCRARLAVALGLMPPWAPRPHSAGS